MTKEKGKSPCREPLSIPASGFHPALKELYGFGEDHPFVNVEVSVGRELIKLGNEGLLVDRDCYRKQVSTLRKLLAFEQVNVDKLAGQSVRVNSLVDVRRLLYDKLS